MRERENLQVQHRARANQRTDRHDTDTTMGITYRRLFDRDANLNESARTGFLAGHEGGKLGELMAAQSGRILRGALDRMVSSSANYWVGLLSDVVGALAFLMFGL